MAMAMAMATANEVPFRGPIRGPPKIPRPFGALPYSQIWWSDSDSDSECSSSNDDGPMGNYYQMRDETKDFMSLEEYYALQEVATKTFFDKLTDCFAVFKRLIFGYSS